MTLFLPRAVLEGALGEIVESLEFVRLPMSDKQQDYGQGFWEGSKER